MSEWDAIKDGVIAFMESYRADCDKEERVVILSERYTAFAEVYHAWWASQPQPRMSLPRAIELMRRPEVRSLVEEDNDADVDVDAFEPLIEHFLAWTAEWRTKREDELRALVRASDRFKNVPHGTDPLALAALAFTCTRCPMYYENPLLPGNALLSYCCLYPRKKTKDVQHVEDPYECAMLWASPYPDGDFCATWNVEKDPIWHRAVLAVDQWADCAAEVVRACGKDPRTTTQADMDAAGVRLWCKWCDKDGRRTVMRWQAAVRVPVRTLTRRH